MDLIINYYIYDIPINQIIHYFIIFEEKPLKLPE